MDKTYPKGNIQSDIHDLRKEIDKVIGLSQVLRQDSKPNTNPNERNDFGREISLVITKLQEAKMWAGKCLEMLGSELPVEYRDEAK